MITLYRASYQNELRAKDLAGLSTDTKPIENIENGSWYTEIDTGNKFRFDKENQVWIKQP